MKKEDAQLLNQLVQALEESGKKLGQAFAKKDSETFNKIKKNMIKMQEDISKLVK